MKLTPDKLGVALTYQNLFWMTSPRDRARTAVPEVTVITDEIHPANPFTGRVRIQDTSQFRMGMRFRFSDSIKQRMGHTPRLFLAPQMHYDQGTWM